MRTSQAFFTGLFFCCIAVVSWGIFRATPPQELFQQSDKVAHLLAFAGLAFTGRLALVNINGYLYWPAMAVIAMAMEYAQGIFQISRYSSVEDAMANVTGVLLALLVCGVGRKVRNG
ncbi:MAG: VanZ family protein [Oceanospirillaceae bacterium]|nr:VanZ family protein [Oceanospirillaceae bacterium]